MLNIKTAFMRFVALSAAAMTVLAALLAVSIALLAGASGGGENALAEGTSSNTDLHVYDPLSDGGVLRLHVVANSDSERDQSVKLAVRDAVLRFETAAGTVKRSENAFSAENALRDGGAGLLCAVNETLESCGADYGAQLELGEFEFPQREYGDVIYPAGRYRALRVLLGDARGKNWWCVLFPPFCIIDCPPAGANAHAADVSAPQESAAPETRVRPVFESLILRLIRLIAGGHGDETR